MVVASWEPQGLGFGGSGHPAWPPSATCWAVRVGAQGWSSPSSSSAVTGHGPTVRMRPGRVTSGSRAAETPSVWGWALTHGFSSTPSSIPLQGFPGFSLPSPSLGSFQGRHLCHEGKLEHGSPRCGQAGCSGFAQGLLRGCSGSPPGQLSFLHEQPTHSHSVNHGDWFEAGGGSPAACAPSSKHSEPQVNSWLTRCLRGPRGPCGFAARWKIHSSH